MARVEGGKAPEAMVAHRATPVGPPAGPPRAGAGPIGGPPPEIVAEMQRKAAELARLGPRARPVYADPKVARYSGAGPVDEAVSFVAATPASGAVPEIAQWAGARK